LLLDDLAISGAVHREKHHMIRTIVVLTAAAFSVGAVMAQGDVIAARKELMKKNAEHTKVIGGIVKGAPYDQAAVDAAFKQWSDTAAALPKAFPDNSLTGDTRALPKIATDRAGFNAQIAALAKAAAAKPKDLEGLKAAFPAVGKVCTDCHEGYRAAAKK
jgi:cytochrome c556